MNDHYDIGIVIVTWNGKPHLERLLPSLLTQDTDKKYKIVIVDNASSDGTREYLSNYSEIDYITLPKNKGFAEPNNAGIRHLFSTYLSIEKIIFLNNDTVVPSTFLSTLYSGFEENPNIGSVQTKIVSFENSNIIDSVGILVDRSMSAINKGQGEIDAGQYDLSSEIFGTTGSAMMISRQALETIDLGGGNYFDPIYFAYQEDVDLAWRLRLSGYVSVYIPGEPVRHVHSATGKNYSAFKAYHIHRNTLFTIVKNMPFPLVWSTLFAFCGRYFGLILSVFRKNGPSYEVSKKTGIFGMMWIVLKSWVYLILCLPILIKKRRSIQKKQKISIFEIKNLFQRFTADSKKIIS